MRLTVIALFLLPVISACVGMQPGEPLGAGADDEMPGPGIFSGESGVFTFGRGNKKSELQKSPSDNPDISKQNLQATFKFLEQKIKRLEQQLKEMEQLKLEVEKKLEED